MSGLRNNKMKEINPAYKYCGCGRRITHHHILCDRCHRKKMKLKKQGFKVDKFKLEEEILTNAEDEINQS